MIRTAIILLGLLVFPTVTPAQQELTLMQVLQQHRRAIGGIDAITTHVTARLRYTVSAEGERSAEMEVTHGEDNAYRETVSGGGRWRSRSFDGETAWQYSALSRRVVSFHRNDSFPRDQFQFQSLRAAAALFPLISAERMGARLSFDPSAKEEMVVLAEYPEGARRRFVLSNGFLITSDTLEYSARGVQLSITREYRDYRAWGDARLPAIVMVRETGTLETGAERIAIRRALNLTLSAVEGNVEFDSDHFVSGAPGRVAEGSDIDLGNMTFRFVGETPTGDEPASLAIVDLTGNGHADILSGEVGGLSLHQGSVDSRLNTRLWIQTGNRVRDCGAMDVDRDGITDLIVTVQGRAFGPPLYLRGLGQGRFASPAPLSGSSHAGTLILADLDGDGRAEVITSGGGETAGINIGWISETGALTRAIALPIGAEPEEIVAADITGDGRADLLAVDRRSLVVLRANGGGFADAVRFDAGPAPWCLAIADVTGDVIPDVIVGNGGRVRDAGAQDIALLVGNGDGTFQSARFVSGGAGITDLALADLDGDGRPELLAVSPATHELLLFTATETGFEFTGSLSVTWTPTALALADLDGDGTIEIVTADESADALGIWSVRSSSRAERR